MSAVVTLKKGEGRMVKSGGMWIFDNEIESVMGTFENGDLVLVHDLLKIANIDEDSLRFYKLGSRYADRIERYGRERSLPVNDVMMI